MAASNKESVSMEELLVRSFAAADALAKLLIEKGPITDEDYATHVETDFGQIEVEYPVG